jgi:hypothetical protein
MFNQYIDFEVHVSPLSASRYAVAVSGPGGAASGALLLPTDDPIFQALATRLASLDTDEETLVELGKLLFQALFQGAIKDVYVRSQGALTPEQGLRLRLSIVPTETAVIALPGEFLYDPDQGPRALLDTPIVRYLPQSAARSHGYTRHCGILSRAARPTCMCMWIAGTPAWPTARCRKAMRATIAQHCTGWW